MSLKIENKGIFFIAVSQFGVAFSFQCIQAFIPFYVLRNSPYGPKETMIWTGMIVGAAGMVAAFTASMWGGLTSRYRPKFLYQRGMVSNGILMFLMAFTSNLHLLLLLRIIQGLLGGVSTIGLILISSTSSGERLHRDMSLFQNAITAGHLLGPPIGAYAASNFGYRAPFFLGCAMLMIATIFCQYYVSNAPVQKKASQSKDPYNRGLLFGWGLCFAVTLHLTFLPGILPNILMGFDLDGDAALEAAGLIIMFYTTAAIVGNHFVSRFTSKVGLIKIIIYAGLIASSFLVAMIFSRGLVSFTALRMIEMGFIAGIMPLTMSLFAQKVSGKRIGFINSSRFIGAAIGPLMATSVLAYFNLLTLYLLIAGLTLIALWGFVTSAK